MLSTDTPDYYMGKSLNISDDKLTEANLGQKEKDREKYLINQIINYLYFEYHSIDLFSTNELERVIEFSAYNKQKTMSLLENYTKEEIIKMIEDFDLKSLKKAGTADRGDTINPEKIFKEVYHIGLRKNRNSPVDFGSAWAFISSQVNMIDLKDLLNTYDHFKLIKKAKSMVKDKDTKKLNEYFDKYYESREKKCRDIFKANLEENDINFLQDDNYMDNEVLKKQKKTIINNVTDKMTDLDMFNKLFHNSGDFVKTNIIEYLDVFSIGKFGLVNKMSNNFVFKKYSLEKCAKIYCLSIFKNTNNYINDQDRLKFKYKSFMSMLAKRPRVRLGGIYYSKVRFNKVGENYGISDQLIRTVNYFRIYRFLPNGEVYSITTPNVKSNKLIIGINKSNIEMKRGRYFIDVDDSLIIELCDSKEKSCIYRYKFGQLEEFPNLKFHSLELLEYSYRSGLEQVQVKINEYFPRLFKYRSLDVLKNEVCLYKTLE